MNTREIDTPIGKLTLAESNGFLTHIFFEGEQPALPSTTETSPVLKQTATELAEYFAGARKTFTVPIKPAGTPYFQRIWTIMQAKVPYGQTISYQELAALAGNERAARAVGLANNRNPIPIIIPCHRVRGKNGTLTGFRAGLDTKQKLLELESH